jgi:DNA mismatch repair protein MutS
VSTIADVRPVLTELPSLLTPDPQASSARPLSADARRDLLIDPVVDRLTRDRQGYQLEEWFTSLVSAADVGYRHEVFDDLGTAEVRAAVARFCEGNLRVRRILAMADRLHYDLERQSWFLEAARGYVATVLSLTEALHSPPRLSSRALQGVAAWLECYVGSAAFQALEEESADLDARLAGIRYRLRVHGDRVQVRPVDPGEPEYAAEVLATFERFRQGDAGSHLKEIRDPGSMDHVEAAIASFVARLHPEPFADLRTFRERHQPLVLSALTRLEREAQFFLAILDLADETSTHGVSWSLPDIASGATVSVMAGYDVVMLLGRHGDATVPNDCQLSAEERLAVVTGPNQGGKTTYARMLGQLHLLAAIGAPVPAIAARLPLVDQIFTLFERGENLADLRGHLQDDLVRARALVDEATPESLVLLNEVYSSTAPDDAMVLGRDLLTRLTQTGGRCVCVTFLDELSRLTSDTVSLVAGVDPDEPTRRTYRVRRRPADGLAYAHALAQQHQLTRADLARRLDR